MSSFPIIGYDDESNRGHDHDSNNSVLNNENSNDQEVVTIGDSLNEMGSVFRDHDSSDSIKEICCGSGDDYEDFTDINVEQQDDGSDEDNNDEKGDVNGDDDKDQEEQCEESSDHVPYQQPYYPMPFRYSYYPPMSYYYPIHPASRGGCTSYVDASMIADPLPDLKRNRGGVTEPFPTKLHQMLDWVEREGRNEVVSFLGHGRAFAIHKPREFEADIMGKFFKQTRFTSFQRQLNLYGFRRIAHGPDNGAYFHELFLRGRPGLCVNMKRTKIKGPDSQLKSDPDSEPNFYAMRPVGVPTMATMTPPLPPPQWSKPSSLSAPPSPQLPPSGLPRQQFAMTHYPIHPTYNASPPPPYHAYPYGYAIPASTFPGSDPSAISSGFPSYPPSPYPYHHLPAAYGNTWGTNTYYGHDMASYAQASSPKSGGSDHSHSRSDSTPKSAALGDADQDDEGAEEPILLRKAEQEEQGDSGLSSGTTVEIQNLESTTNSDDGSEDENEEIL